MVTLNNADSILKSFYLDAVSDALNTKINPFLTRIEKTTANVSGKDVRKSIFCGFNNGIGAGTETGDLPTANGNEYNQMVVGLKNFYGTLEISDKALRASADSDGAFVNLLNEEMRTLIDTAKFNFDRMLFGDGSGVLSTVKACTGVNALSVDNAQNFVAGMLVDLVESDGTCSEVKIVNVNYNSGTIAIEESMDLSSMAGAKIYLRGSRGEELTGLGAVFADCDLYGLDRSIPGMLPYVDNSGGEMMDQHIWDAIDMIEANSGKRPDMLVCSWQVRRVFLEYCRNNNIPLPIVELEGGFKAFMYMDIPVVVDRFCPKDTMYLLNTECFKLHQLCDWQWLESEDGKILKQTPGKPVYTATLVKYAELLCDNPSAQGVIRFTNV